MKSNTLHVDPAYRLVIFDWDGTLMNSTPDIARAIQAACRDLELPVPDAAAANWVIGLSLERALYSVVPDLTEAQRPLFIDRYRYHFLRRDPHIELFDGVRSMLNDLRDRSLTLAVATGKSRVGLDRTLAATGLKDYFAITRCADETFGKPHPAMVQEIMRHVGIEPHEVIMVGDTTHDLDMAANAQVHGLGVTYGAHPIEHLRKSPHQEILHDVASVKRWLLERTLVV
jgi:phosphoglycolate phosphatase